MKNIMTSKVPMWSLILAITVAVFALGFAKFYASENLMLKNVIRTQEAQIPGFLERTSPLSEHATCKRSPLIRLKDRILGSDSCEQSF